MKTFHKLLLSSFFLFLTTYLSAVSVTVTGSAEGNPDKAGELALAEALRNAVREGAGVDVMSESKVSNFQADYDIVMTSSFGYIESYKILEQKYDKSTSIYTIKLQAEVGKSAPTMDKIMALRMLVKRMDSPRVMIICKEKIKGLEESDPSMAAGVIEEITQNNGFELFNQEAIDEQTSKEASRAEILGDTLDAKAKSAGITSTSDFKIIADIKGSVGKLKEPFPEVFVRDTAIGIDLKALWTDTGEVIATVSIPTKNFKGEANMNLPYDMPDQLIRHYLTIVLQGTEKGTENKDVYRLFSKIISKWITELDLGYKIKLEFKAIDKAQLDNFIAKLKDVNGVTYAWRREYDKRLFSIVEVETRLTSSQLEGEILKIMDSDDKANKAKYEVDQATKRSLRFIPVKD